MAYEQIPTELRKLKRWGLFHLDWVEARKKYNKIPINPYTGEDGKSNDESTWADFDTALAALATNDNTSGLAFYFKPPYIGMDIDHVDTEIKDYVDGDTSNIVADFMGVNSYAETSVSGEGIHIIAKGKIEGNRRRRGNVEMYQSGRFFALTGNAFGSHTDVIATVNPDKLKHLYDTYVAPHVDTPAISPSTQPTVDINDLSEQEVVDAMMKSKGAPRIKSLLQGKWDGLYSSQSEADMALANDLAFWTAKDYTKMDSIFRSSGLMRPKYDEKHGKVTYGEGLLNKAINDTSDTYQPKHDADFWVSVPGLTVPDNPAKIKWRSYDDTGLAQRYIDAYGKITKYDTASKKFMYFDGIRWNYDEHFVVPNMLNNVIDALKNEPVHTSAGVDEKDEQAAEEARAKFVKHSRSNAGKKAAEAEIMKLVAVTPNDFDTTLGVLNTPSGYVNLSSGEIKDAVPTDLFTKSTMAEYSPTAEATRWMDFLNTVFEGNQELITFVQRAVGYSLLGTNEQSVMMIVHGVGGHENGSNGKSVFVETLRSILGDYAVTIDPETIMVKRFGSDSKSLADIASLKGTRMAVTSESESGARLNESLVKRMTGGEEMRGKNLYAQPFSFKPTSVLWMSTNHKPIVRGSDEGIWRRLLFIPFTAVIDEAHRDPLLKDKLMTESAGILNWAIDGALAYQMDHRLHIPDIVREQNSEYRSEMDTVGAFIDECGEEGKGYRATNAEIHTAFETWSDANGVDMKMAGLNRELGNRYTRFVSNGKRGFEGFKIIKPTQQFDF